MLFKKIKSSSRGNLYTVTSTSNILVIDAGMNIGKVQKELEYEFENIVGVLISHAHLDHSKYAADFTKLGIDIYASEETIKQIETFKVNKHRMHRIRENEVIYCGPFKILPFSTVHSVENFGFLISDGEDKLLFMTDSRYCPVKTKGVSIFAIECNYINEILKENIESKEVAIPLAEYIVSNHMSLENLKHALRKQDLSKTREIHLLHLSDKNACEEKMIDEIEKEFGVAVYV